MNVFSQFRKEIVRKQTKLYNTLASCQASEFEDVDYLEEKSVKEEPSFSMDDSENETIIQTLKMDENLNEDEVEEEIVEALDECVDYLAPSFSVTILNTSSSIHQCDICSFHGNTKMEIAHHMNQFHHEKDLESIEGISIDSQIFICDLCSMKFSKRHLLNRHTRLKHTAKERNYTCQYCEKSFYNNSNLKKHEESHGSKDMPCEFCGKLFTCMNNLRTHLYYHSEPKFVCNFQGCNKRFFMRKLLKAHLNVRYNFYKFLERNSTLNFPVSLRPERFFMSILR